MKNKELLFTLTKKDFNVEVFCAGGHGGQNMQKNATACRIVHPASGAVGLSRDERSQLQNKKKAFERLCSSEEFKKWHKIQCAKFLGLMVDTEKWVEDQMDVKNLRVEIQKNGKWIKVNPFEIPDDYEELDEE